MGTPRGEGGLQGTMGSVGKEKGALRGQGLAPLQMHKVSQWPSCGPRARDGPICHPHVLGEGGRRGPGPGTRGVQWLCTGQEGVTSEDPAGETWPRHMACPCSPSPGP